jgi:DNA-binding transcriptional regulator PaaX
MTRTQQHVINRLKAGDKLSILSVSGYAILSGHGHKREKFQSATIKRMESAGLIVATSSKGSNFEIFYALSERHVT